MGGFKCWAQQKHRFSTHIKQDVFPKRTLLNKQHRLKYICLINFDEMINRVFIKNYKSVENLSIGLGKVNVFIGANGSGKSNILEAIAFGAAAAGKKLDNESLSLRGIRVADPILMRNAFDDSTTDESVSVSFKSGKETKDFEIVNSNEDFSKWKINQDRDIQALLDAIRNIQIEIGNDLSDVNTSKIKEAITQTIFKEDPFNDEIKNFLIYSPENYQIRRFDDETNIQPLGIYGEGLFKLIKSMDDESRKSLKGYLKIIDWFEDFHIKEDLLSNERMIQLTDRYISNSIEYFDQRSANEGFLFLLFYLSLFISKHTPSFFAIDNIDNALNPKLCIDLLRLFNTLTTKYEKQVILTTHNPAILDGLDIRDKNQRLYVVFRNLEGVTKIKRITEKLYNPDGPARLSEAFTRGYIGGLNLNTMKW